MARKRPRRIRDNGGPLAERRMHPASGKKKVRLEKLYLRPRTEKRREGKKKKNRTRPIAGLIPIGHKSKRLTLGGWDSVRGEEGEDYGWLPALIV